MTEVKYNPEKHKRRSVRLRGHDYTRAGAYFLTVCTHDKECAMGEIEDDEMHLNGWGKLAQLHLEAVPEHFPSVDLDTFITMPNHTHAIVLLHPPSDTSTAPVGAGSPRPPQRAGTRGEGAGTAPLRPTLGQVVAYFKYQSTKAINETRQMPGVRFWQRNYYEHIIRSPDDLDRIRQYIAKNPARWAEDEENPARVKHRRGGVSPPNWNNGP